MTQPEQEQPRLSKLSSLSFNEQDEGISKIMNGFERAGKKMVLGLYKLVVKEQKEDGRGSGGGSKMKVN